jgi:hypothetical protein
MVAVRLARIPMMPGVTMSSIRVNPCGALSFDAFIKPFLLDDLQSLIAEEEPGHETWVAL